MKLLKLVPDHTNIHFLRWRVPFYVISLLLMAASRVLFPGLTIPFHAHRLLSTLLVVAGLFLLFGAAWQFRREQTTLDPRAPGRATRFVAKGLYRFSRNPMYLGMALLLFGAAAWSSSLLAYLLAACFCVYIHALQIKPEERALRAAFGDDYAAYMASVRRWI